MSMHPFRLAAGLVLAALVAPAGAAAEQSAEGGAASAQALVGRYCVTCHNDRLRTGNLALDGAELADVGAHADLWERVLRKLTGRVMPPIGRPRPAEDEYEQLTSWLEAELDGAWEAAPNPGRKETFHRLNRAEYGNAVRDLLALDIDVDDFLPADNASYGFDNIAGALRMSQSLVERYLAAAGTISRMAIGSSAARRRLAQLPHRSGHAAAASRRGAAVRHPRRTAGGALLPADRGIRHSRRRG